MGKTLASRFFTSILWQRWHIFWTCYSLFSRY